MKSDPVLDSYLAEVARIPLLTEDQEKTLSRRAKAGDTEAREQLIVSSLRFVIKIARQFQGRGLGLADLIGEGNIGLTTAVDRFDPEKGFRLSTYAAWWIRQRIHQALSHDAPRIRLPSHTMKQVKRYRSACASLRESLGRDPSVRELGSHLSLPVERVREVVHASRVNEESSRAAGTETLRAVGGMLRDEGQSPEEIVTSNSVLGDLRDVLHMLDDRQNFVVRTRFGLDSSEPATLKQIGTQLNLTRERVRQILNESLDALRAMLAIRHERRTPLAQSA